MVDEPGLMTPKEDDDGPDRVGLWVFIGILLMFVGLWIAAKGSSSELLLLTMLLVQVALISVVIWQACDPFADAAQWIGMMLQLPGSVRGATLDAVASSMPELFSGIFFVIAAITAADATDAARVTAGAEGYGATIATCAGSAVYNMILIPAFCALVISFARPSRPTIDVDDEVISRDGVWFVACELLLIVFLFNERMSWWMGAVFLAIYVVYIVTLYRHAMRYRGKMAHLGRHFEAHGASGTVESVIKHLAADGVAVSRALVIHAQERYVETNDVREEIGEDEVPETAGACFGYFRVPLSYSSAWMVIVFSTIVAAAACYFLVEVTNETAAVLGVPTFFVAVVLAAAASSVPDTFLAIGAARRGDDSGAVSNAFGSNIFDICICLSIPLFVNSYLTGWQPVSLMQDGKPIAGLVALRVMLVVLTLVTLAIMWHRRQLTRTKAIVLCTLYLVFIGYAVVGSLGFID